MRLRIDTERCTGHGRCYMLAPALIEPDDDGNGRVVVAEVPPDRLGLAERAVANCPEDAVSLDAG